jgi:hypothetical protein
VRVKYTIKGISTKLYKDKLHDKTLLCHVLHCPNNKEYFIIAYGMCLKNYKEKRLPKHIVCSYRKLCMEVAVHTSKVMCHVPQLCENTNTKRKTVLMRWPL